MNKMKIIGLTGGIGSGKSTVASMLAKLGGTVIDADFIGHQVLEDDPNIKEQLVNRFGSSILNLDSTINRDALAKAAFASHDDTEFLNRLIHPVIYSRLESMINIKKETGANLLVIEAPLLIEAGWGGLVDTVWVTEAPLEIRLARLSARGMPRREALRRINAQMSDEERRISACTVIDTNVDLPALKIRVTQLFASFLLKKY